MGMGFSSYDDERDPSSLYGSAEAKIQDLESRLSKLERLVERLIDNLSRLTEVSETHW